MLETGWHPHYNAQEQVQHIPHTVFEWEGTFKVNLSNERRRTGCKTLLLHCHESNQSLAELDAIDPLLEMLPNPSKSFLDEALRVGGEIARHCAPRWLGTACAYSEPDSDSLILRLMAITNSAYFVDANGKVPFLVRFRFHF
jgi:hypothetical protein